MRKDAENFGLFKLKTYRVVGFPILATTALLSGCSLFESNTDKVEKSPAAIKLATVDLEEIRRDLLSGLTVLPLEDKEENSFLRIYVTERHAPRETVREAKLVRVSLKTFRDQIALDVLHPFAISVEHQKIVGNLVKAMARFCTKEPDETGIAVFDRAARSAMDFLEANVRNQYLGDQVREAAASAYNDALRYVLIGSDGNVIGLNCP